jgi:hypothetical protein
LGFEALAAEVSPFKDFIAGDKRVQGTERGLLEFEFSIFHEPDKMLRALREVQNLLLIRKLSATHGHSFEQRLYFGERERIALQDTSVPNILG